MVKRSFRVFATKEDLQNIFKSFEQDCNVYYLPRYCDNKIVKIKDITRVRDFGVNTSGTKLINNYFLIFNKDCECKWVEFPIYVRRKLVNRYSFLCEENTEYITVDIGGVHNYKNLFPTEISTINYENEASKALYYAIRRAVYKHSVTIEKGYYICQDAYNQKLWMRYCTKDITSPKKYDLIIK